MGHWVSPGVGDVGSYQVAGTPFVIASTGAAVTKTFEYVTSAVTVSSSTDGATISFGDTADTAFKLQKAGTFRFEVKCKTVTITPAGAGDVSAVIELTSIPATSLEQHNQANLGS